MKKNIQIILAVILTLCTLLCVAVGCGKNQPSSETDSETNTESSEISKEIKNEETYSQKTTVYSDENYTYHSVVSETTTDKKAENDNVGASYSYASTTEYIPITIVTEPKTTSIAATTTTAAATTQTTAATTTKRNSLISTKKADEISKGIGIITKTSPVKPGNTATVTILGNPNKSYTIEFYEEGSTPSVGSGLEIKTANKAGFVSWTFSISPLCSAGSKKIIIREKGSDNYVQTTIEVK